MHLSGRRERGEGREQEIEREGGRERAREREGGRERESEREREREREMERSGLAAAVLPIGQTAATLK